MAAELPVINVHTPTSSFAIIFSSEGSQSTTACMQYLPAELIDTEDTLLTLFDKISKKSHAEFHGRRVKSGWVKYSWNDSIWNLDDGKLNTYLIPGFTAHCDLDSDFTIFVWRHKSITHSNDAPALHVRNSEEPLPSLSEYKNHSFYMFKAPPQSPRPSPSVSSQSADRQSTRSKKSKKSKLPVDAVPAFKKEFEQFHNENGVRTVMGGIGPVNSGKYLPFHSA